MEEFLYKYKTFGIIGLLVMGLIFYNIFQTNTTVESQNSMIYLESSNEFISTDIVEDNQMEMNPTMYVDIKGAVHNPGIYKIESDMRVFDVIELSGGLLDEADQNQINLSKRLNDQMVIYIPKIGESLPDQFEIEVSQKTDESKNETVNINTADQSELQTLPGIGEKKALNIIRHREEEGTFKDISELKKVDGIGDKTFEQLSGNITV